MTAPQITHRSPATLTPWPRNARTHSKKQIRQIVASIRQFGFTVPVPWCTTPLRAESLP